MIHSDGEWEPDYANELPIPLSGSDCVGTAHDTFLLIALFFSPCAVLLPLRPARDKNGKAGPAAGSRDDVNAVAQNSERVAHDEETDAQTVASCGIKPGEGLEDSWNFLTRNSSARVVHIDPDSRTGVPAANKDATSRLGVLDGIADQIAQGGAEKQAIAQYGGVAGNHLDAYALAQRGLFVLAASLPQHLLDAHRRQLEAPRRFSDAQRSQDLLQLLLKPVDGVLTGPQTSQFGARSDSKCKEFVSALNDLEWLPEIVPGYGEQHRLEVRDSVRPSSGRHIPRYRSRRASGCPETLVAFFRPDMVAHVAHARSLADEY
jgi:hypothetical protein